VRHFGKTGFSCIIILISICSNLRGGKELDQTDRKEIIRERAKELGLDSIVFLPVRSFPLWEKGIQLRKFMDPDTAGYWEKRGLTQDVRAVLPDAATIIAAACPYAVYQYPFSPGKGYYSAHYAAYPRARAAMTELGAVLQKDGYQVKVDPPLPMKEIAYRGGLGKYGRNGLIHNKQSGSLMTLHVLLTDAVLPPDEVDPGELCDCGDCRLCIRACPMNAIAGNGVVQIRRCLRYYMMSPGIVPVGIREKLGDRMLGCEDCQIACPRNWKRYRNAVEAGPGQKIFPIRRLLSDYAVGLKKYMVPVADTIGKNYARPRRILSMAVIVAGNSGDPSYLPLLAETLRHPHPPIRVHSAWAIGKLGGIPAEGILKAAGKEEKDPGVQEEIRLAGDRVRQDFLSQGGSPDDFTPG